MSAQSLPLLKDLLPPRGQALVNEIEGFAGRQIELLPNPHPISPTDPNPNGPASAINSSRAHVYVRDLDATPAAGLIHELLHIRRYWVEGVPQICPKESLPDRWEITGAIENALEHLIIVPQEAEFGAVDRGHWNETSGTNWGRYPWPDMLDMWARRKNCILGWLGIELVDDLAVRKLARANLTREGYFSDAQRLLRLVRPAIRARKEEAIIATVDALGIPRSDVKLVYFDPRTGVDRSLQLRPN